VKNSKLLFPGVTWQDSESLTAVLQLLGLDVGCKTQQGNRIILMDGREVFRGRAGAVWAWLRKGCPVASWWGGLAQ
jgi:hypothetical protein